MCRLKERAEHHELKQLERLLGDAWAAIQQAEELLAARGVESEELRDQRNRLYAFYSEAAQRLGVPLVERRAA